jgi:hypothetical protein
MRGEKNAQTFLDMLERISSVINVIVVYCSLPLDKLLGRHGNIKENEKEFLKQSYRIFENIIPSLREFVQVIEVSTDCSLAVSVDYLLKGLGELREWK